MKPDTLKKSIDSVRPDNNTKNAMLNAILASPSPQNPLSLRPISVLLAVFCLMVIAGFMVWFGNMLQIPADTPGIAPIVSTSQTELAVVTDEFEWDGRSYAKTSGSEGVPQTADSSQIGQKLTTIQNSIDSSLIGCSVYQYLPVRCNAAVVVLRNQTYEIFTFRTFESYQKNADEDASSYLLLYGILSPEDLAKIEITVFSSPNSSSGHMESANGSSVSITDPEDLQEFYAQFSILKDSSDLYFQQLNLYIPNSDFSTNNPSSSAASSKSVSSSSGNTASQSGTTALNNGTRIRIHAVNGLSFDIWYYPHIGFLSRYQLSDSFIDWIESHSSFE